MGRKVISTSWSPRGWISVPAQLVLWLKRLLTILPFCYRWQVPGSVQASAASKITFTEGSMVALMGGFGIGNDPNAHTSGVGVGAKNIEISKMFITQTGSNPITVGGK
jgi:hypothetical protein